MSKVARIEISSDLLAQALHFPEGTVFRNCLGGSPTINGGVLLIVEHEDLPDVEVGGLIPQITPMFERIAFDWNLDSAKAKE